MTKPLSDDNLDHLRSLLEEPEFLSSRYEVIRKLGSGGMATVFLGRDRELDRQIAIKVLSLGANSGQLADRLIREARIIASLEHPGIIPIHDVGRIADDRVFYVMKYVEGETLGQYALRNTNRPELLRIFAKVCEAVAFAHARNVIHRDIKPENVMVGSFGEVLLMDWGIALNITDLGTPLSAGQIPASESKRLTDHGTVLGTPAYMSPEQARGDNTTIDARSDIYSLGAVLYFLITKRHPFTESDREELRRSVIQGSFTPPRQASPEISRALNGICIKAMANDPRNRYQSASELSSDLINLAEQLPVSAYRENVLERLRRWLSRHKIIVLVIVGYILVRILIYLRIGL